MELKFRHCGKMSGMYNLYLNKCMTRMMWHDPEGIHMVWVHVIVYKWELARIYGANFAFLHYFLFPFLESPYCLFPFCASSPSHPPANLPNHQPRKGCVLTAVFSWQKPSFLWLLSNGHWSMTIFSNYRHSINHLGFLKPGSPFFKTLGFSTNLDHFSGL